MSNQKCLVISRHELIQKQIDDIKLICNSVELKPSLPIDFNALKEFTKDYDAIIGNLPINIYVLLLNLGKDVYQFNVRNIKTITYFVDYLKARENAMKEYEDIKDFVIFQDPDLKTKTFRVSKYLGLLKLNKIVIESTKITNYE